MFVIALGQVNSLVKRFSRTGVGENYIRYLVVTVILLGIGDQRGGERGGFEFIIWRADHNEGPNFYVEIDPFRHHVL